MVAIGLILLFSVGIVGAQNPDLAAVFIDYILHPPVSADINARDGLKIAIVQ
jgi:hypothetical protein